MKDEALREALQQAAKREPAVGDPFARFELVRRRSSVARGAVLVGLSILILLSFGLMFPNPLLRGNEGEVQVGGELQPLPRDVKIYRDRVAGYELTYPSFWDLVGAEGESVAFYVPGRFKPGQLIDYLREGPTLFEEPASFYVRVTPEGAGGLTSQLNDRRVLRLLGDAGAIITEGNVLAEERGQRREDQLRIVFGPEPIGEDADQVPFWCRSCRIIELTLILVRQPDVPALHVRIVGPDQASFTEHFPDAGEILLSVQRLIEGDRAG